VGRGPAPAPARPRTRGRHPRTGEEPVVRAVGAAARPHTHGRHLQAVEARAVRPAGAAARPRSRERLLQAAEARAHPQTHGRQSRTSAAPVRPGGRERCPRAGRAGVGRRGEKPEGLHAPGRDPRSGAQRVRTAPGRQSRPRHRRPDAARAARRFERAEHPAVGMAPPRPASSGWSWAARRGEWAEPPAVGTAMSPVAGWAPGRRGIPQGTQRRPTTRQHPEAARQSTPPGRPAARHPRCPCPANPRRPQREQPPPGPPALAHPRLHRPPRRRTSSPAQTATAPVPVRQMAKADRLEAGATRRWGRGRREVRTGPRPGADRSPAEGQVASRPWEPGRWGWSPAMPAPRWKPLAPLPRREAHRPGPTRRRVALDPPQRSPLGPDRPRWPHPSRQSAPGPHRPFPPATLRPRPPGRARHQPRQPGREHPSDPGPARPLHPTPGPGQMLGQEPRAPRTSARPARQQGEGPAAWPPPDPRPAAPTQEVRRVLGDLGRDARAGGRDRSFGPRKLPRAAPGRASGPAYRGRRASATALVHNPRRPIPPAAFEG
jgi:hypothetical protein